MSSIQIVSVSSKVRLTTFSRSFSVSTSLTSARFWRISARPHANNHENILHNWSHPTVNHNAHTLTWQSQLTTTHQTDDYNKNLSVCQLCYHGKTTHEVCLQGPAAYFQKVNSFTEKDKARITLFFNLSCLTLLHWFAPNCSWISTVAVSHRNSSKMTFKQLNAQKQLIAQQTANCN